MTPKADFKCMFKVKFKFLKHLLWKTHQCMLKNIKNKKFALVIFK